MAARPRSTTSRASRWRRPSCGAAPRGSRRWAGRRTPGTKLFCISGHVNKPCNVEEETRHPAAGADRALRRRRARRLGQSAGGHPRRRLGAAASRRSICDTVLMDFDCLRDVKSGLGTAAVIVMDKSTDVIKAICAALEVLQARELRPVHAVPRGHRLDDAGDGRGWCEGDAETEEIDTLRAGDAAGRGPHDLRARRCGGLADPGADPAFPAGDGGAHRRLQGATGRPRCRWRRSRAMAESHRRRHRGRGAERLDRAAGLRGRRARRSRASAITSACRSPAIAACAWSRSRRRRSRSRPAPIPVADRHGGQDRHADGAQGAARRDGVPAHQPSARLPDLRPGRRMRPAGPGDRLRHGPLALSGEQARGEGQVSRSAGQDRDDALHPLHALHPLRDRGRRRARSRRHGARREHGGRHLCREGARLGAVRQYHRHLPGRRADLEAVRLHRAAVGAEEDRQRRRAGRGRHQHPHRYRAAARCCAFCRASTRT